MSSLLQAFLVEPSLDSLLEWCDEHCAGVSDGRVKCFDLGERTDVFWPAVRKVANSYATTTKPVKYDVVLSYPGHDADGNVLDENNFACLVRNEVGRRGKTVYYADFDCSGRFDENIAKAIVQCDKVAFFASREWFLRRWCLAEMLLAMASTDDMGVHKCKVIECDDRSFKSELLPLHGRVLRARRDHKKLLSIEAVRLVDWLFNLSDAERIAHAQPNAIPLHRRISNSIHAFSEHVVGAWSRWVAILHV